MEPFHREIREFVLFFQMCAFSPFGQNPLQTRFLKFYSLISLLLVFLLFISAFGIYSMVEKTTMLSIIDTSVFSGQLLTHLLVIVQSYTTRRKQMLLLEKIGQIDEVFQKKFRKHFHYRNKRGKYRLKFGFLILLVIVVNCGFFVNIMQLNKIPKLFVYWIHVLYPMVIIRFRCIQNTFYVDLLGERFHLVNSKLMDIIRCEGELENRSKLILCIDYIYANGVANGVQANYNDIIVLKDIYGKLWNSINLINDCFGWSNLVIITQFFLEFVSHGYWLFAGLDDLTSIDKVIGSILVLMPVIVVLTSLCYSCFICKDAVVFLYFFYFSHINYSIR